MNEESNASIGIVHCNRLFLVYFQRRVRTRTHDAFTEELSLKGKGKITDSVPFPVAQHSKMPRPRDRQRFRISSFDGLDGLDSLDSFMWDRLMCHLWRISCDHNGRCLDHRVHGAGADPEQRRSRFDIVRSRGRFHNMLRRERLVKGMCRRLHDGKKTWVPSPLKMLSLTIRRCSLGSLNLRSVSTPSMLLTN